MAMYFPGVTSNRPQIHSFTNTASITITHNLGYLPMVQVILEDGSVAHAQVSHASTSEVVITFQISLTGNIILR